VVWKCWASEAISFIRSNHFFALVVFGLSFKSETKIELEFLKQDLRIKFHSDRMRDLILKRSQVPREKLGSEARRLLAASLAECMCSTLLFLLKWAGVDSEGFKATAETITSKDEKGRLCVDSINLTVHLDILEDVETSKKIQRVESLLKRGCLISRSLERGIRVRYSLAK